MGLPLLEYGANQPPLDDMPIPRRGEWVSVVTHLDPRYGGLSAAVPRLAAALGDTCGLRASIAAFCAADEVWSPVESAQLVVTRWPASRLAWWKDRRLTRDFHDQLKGAEGLHIHGLWELSTSAAAHAARELGKPYLLSAHGMLESWALHNKRIKKVIYSAFIEKRNIRGAACLHALARAEAEDYRRFGVSSPIA